MKSIKPKYLLTLPGEIDSLPYLSINLEETENFDKAPELYFEDMESILEFIDELGKSNSILKNKLSDTYFDNGKTTIEKEILEDSASSLLDIYFNMFDKDYINKDEWALFSNIFGLDNPIKKTNYILSNNKINKEIRKDQLLASCFMNGKIDKSKINEILKLFINKDTELTNISFDYLCDNSKELLSIIIQRIFETKSNAVIKRCENCNKLYIPKKLDTKYCDRISPQYEDKTCKQAMDLIKKNKALNDPIKRLYKNVYNTLYISLSHNNSKENKKTLKDFVKQNKIKASEYEKGTITTQEYEYWLKSFYKRK